MNSFSHQTENQVDPACNGSNPSPTGSRKNINSLAVLALLLLLSVAIYPIIKIFFVPVVVAGTFATLLSPLYRVLLRLLSGRKGISSFFCCLIIFLCLVIPTYFVVYLVVRQAVDLYQSAEPVIKDILTQGSRSRFWLRLQELPFAHWLQLSSINLSVPISEAIKTIALVGTKTINKTSAGLLEFLINLVVMFFTMFYFFRDGAALVRKVKHLVPIRDDYKELIQSRFLLISRASVMGTVIIGVLQGSLGSLTLLAFGIKHWLVWGFIMIILSCMPVIGSWVVLVPAGIIQIACGHPLRGVGIILISLLVISNLDGLIRPRLVGQGANLHALVIFFSSLGGIAVFGIMGFIVGPVIAALFVAVLDIYSREFEKQLDSAPG